ncbi:hypothetical protein LPJGGPFB_04957 [Ensifer adhaerens]|uniref:MarR family winged helix-turn-helix transcriptional regulator n=1 Tax=Ensifer adhaerens TaxID=106592 RepID=UPI001568031D|nr:MarR family winged helix-turn-helix transcriptional regulator [Ensifer adhaerens]NRP21698.1 hypothetical protein [Ensifer adhaerens]
MSFIQNDDLCSAFLRLNRRLSRKINAALKIHELTGEQAVVLQTIAALDCPRVTDLRIALGLDPSTVSANLKPLSKRQFVAITEDVVDRRVRRVELTPQGLSRLQSSRKILKTRMR